MANIASLRVPAPPVAEPPPQAPASPRTYRRRRRIATGLALAIVALAIALPAILFGSGSTSAPATGAAALVPADALAYVHLSTDHGRPALSQSTALEHRLPELTALANSLNGRLTAILGGGSQLDYARDIKPWLGREAALALLDTTSTTAGSELVLDVRDAAKARALLARAGASVTGRYRGVAIESYPTGTELAFVKHYLVLGQDASVRAAIDVAGGAARSLAASSDYRAATTGEPSDRVLDAYASAAGMRRLLGGASGALGALGTLLAQPAATGTSVTLSPASGGMRVRIHSALDPSLLRLSGRRAQFTAALPRLLPSGSMLLLDTARLDRAAPRLLGALGTLGIAGGVQPLLDRLGKALVAQGVNVQKVLSLLDGEAAIGLTPSTTGAGPAPVIVARTSQPALARQTLAELEVPLEQLFPTPASGPGLQTEWNDVQAGGETVHQLAVAPGLQLDYAVFDGLVVVSTTPDAIASIAHHARALSSDSAYRAAVGDQPARVTSLLFFDFSQLLSLAEQTGLTSSARFGAIGPDLARIHAVGLSSTAGETDTTAELFLQIS
ncbi:MAG TPA: DUF3352 domain-containing protein [Solirubrobacteraceae bacterium]|jgi:hypothetical protein